MKTADCNCVVFNSKKHTIQQPQISFYGIVFTQHGLWPDWAKVHALQDLPTAINQKELQSFLGSINYLQPFIPDLSNKIPFLWAQIANWDWNPSTDSAFQQVIAWICYKILHTTLTYYDWEKPVTIQINASQYGLGTALLQDGHPITFAKILTDTETRYTNIKREC